MNNSKIIRAICILIAIVNITCLCITANAETSLEPITVSYKNKETVEKTIFDFIEQYKTKTPSVSIAVFDNNQDICNIYYGDADKSNNIKVDENTVYEWGSISKLLVWTSAMQLYEQGKLDLNKDIQYYLPSGFLKNLSFDEPITMLDLMNHSAGFQETTVEIETSNINDIVSLDKALSNSAPAQVARPGETVSYSNWGAALGGYVVSCVSGMDYVDYVHKNIFDKLGMEHTYLRPDGSDNEWASEQRHLLHSYSLGFDDDSMTDMGECRVYINLYPAGSAGGTISDLAKFARALLCDSKDCPLFEKDDTLDLMLSPSWTFGDGSPRICHGLFYTPYGNGNGLFGHGGNTMGCSSDLQLDLKNKTGYVMMINTQSDRVYTMGLPELLYGKEYIPAEYEFEKVDISGHYRIGRSCGGAGMLKIGSPFEDALTIYKNGENFSGSNGIAKATQISDTFVEMELINGTKRYYAIKKDANGNLIALESYQAVDFVKQSNKDYYTEWIMIILLIVSIIVPAILFVIHIILYRKYKNTDIGKFKKTELIASFMSLLVLIEAAIICLNLRAFLYAGKGIYATFAIVLCTLALAEFILLLRCQFYKKEEKPNNRIILNIETVCSVLLIIGIIYWRLFQWWGF